VRSVILPAFCVPGRPLKPEVVVLHYMSARNVENPDRCFELEACRNLLIDLNRPRADRQLYMRSEAWPVSRMFASCHVLVGRDGETWRLCEYEKQAWHAGASLFRGRANLNNHSLGIELVGHIHSKFTDVQYDVLATLLIELMERYGFGMDAVVGHDTVRHNFLQANPGSPIKPKYDPSGNKAGTGDNFRWDLLRDLVGSRRALPPVTIPQVHRGPNEELRLEPGAS
jgi:N-acetyl-anhydromuramyl-L-alanine amidase AmpD